VKRLLGWSSESFLSLEGGYAVAAELVGCVMGGFVASWLGSKRSVILSIVALAACWFAYAATANMWTDKTLIALLFCAVAGAGGFFQVSMFALFMGICRAPVAATQFSAYMALLNVSSGWGALFAGYITPGTNLVTVFAGLGCFQLVMIPIVALINPTKEPTAEAGTELPASPLAS
jgi:MFS family permease